MTRVLALADTHVRPGSSRRLPKDVYRELPRADVILHAGDVVTADLLQELGGFAPVHAVLGNNDHELVGILPEVLELELDGVHLAMIHDSGAAKARAGRLHRRFPSADVVLFGHSHQPLLSPGIDGQLLCNPGSPTWRRTAATATVATLELHDGEVTSATLLDV